MKAFLCVFLLLALPSSATCLKCVQCLSDEETCTDSTDQECKPGEDTCISGVIETLYGKEKTISSFKVCFPSKKCEPGYFSTTFGTDKYSWSNIRCCQTDLCNRDDVPLPPRNATLNGLRCPSCFSNTLDHCHSQETVGCTHNEDRCLTFAESIKEGDKHQTVALQGCSTKNTCAIQKGVLEIADGWYVQNITQVDCQPALEKSPIKG